MKTRAGLGLCMVLVGLAGCRAPAPDLGQSISEPKALFGGDLTVQAFQEGLRLGLKDGTSQVLLLVKDKRRVAPHGDIAKFYQEKGQEEALGRPLEGEHLIFNDTYRLHVFQKGVVFWRTVDRKIETLICTGPFDS